MPAESTVGQVIAVCSSPEGGVPKWPRERVTVGDHGIEGDYHAGPTRVNRHGESEPNRRQVTVVAAEAIESIEAELGCSIPPGGFGENVLVRGLGDLGWLEAGDVLEFAGGVVLEVTGQNNPCTNLQVWHPDIVRAAYGRRGVLAVVVATGVIEPGERVTVRRRPVRAS